MIKTSERYDPFPRLREVDCRISFGVIDQNGRNSVISGNDAGFLPRYAQTVDDALDADGKWADLELDLWGLDGTYDLIPDDMDVQTGWWSSVISGADGRFENPPYIQYDFAGGMASIGWMLYFDAAANQYAAETVMELLNADGSVKDTRTYVGKSAVQKLRYPGGAEYFGIRFRFLRTSEPFRRIRLVQTDFGLMQYYDRDTVGMVQFVGGAAIDGSAFPARQLVFSFDNTDKDFNLLNPDGVYQFMQEGQIITAKLLIGGEAVDMGTFVFSSADASASAILPTVTAHDLAYTLDKYGFEGGRDEETTLGAAVSEVLGVTAVSLPVHFGDGIANRRVHMSISFGTSVRKALQQLAQAARCSVYISRDGVLRFENLVVKDVPDGILTENELYDFSGIGISEFVHGIRLTVKDDFRIGKDGTPGRQVYFYAGDNTRAEGYSNPCVADSEGQAVADWLLSAANLRKRYKVKNRCDPAVEVGDTLQIADAFRNQENAVVTGFDIKFEKSLSATTEAIGI